MPTGTLGSASGRVSQVPGAKIAVYGVHVRAAGVSAGASPVTMLPNVTAATEIAAHTLHALASLLMIRSLCCR
ncbi:hypothetical protein [Nocardia seriolae]|uniref:Acetoacetyl-CoA synthase n=1 Tax=Nocardia seriolae TaxID=37332 RepID=A0ABC9Z3Z2_9NOCA|nr:hypothetical protein [Nocardia seriolae]OJF82285.1 hypothetical protein NS14008_27995 [Nocardia seriolae]WKY56605.1 hypothetical protein Q5P07_07980 [Nocardia seriolae]BAW09240.1 hypothetical protein NSERUTF1_6154 [Nocardia seriolae]GAM50512.1 acetoacetyl-CoA synthase [Nocardia seriolae]GAP32474.1 acetoacetyl-CoA synthase [Nocardia seriolae]